MEGFTIGKNQEYACIPYAKKGYIVIHQGGQLERLCRTEATARKYVAEHKKSQSKAKLPEM